jgi:hypothetical protein
MRIFLIACAGALALGGSAALAQDMTTGQLSAIDANADGAVDAAELDAWIAQAFTSLDTNGDGYVTVTEGMVVMTPEQWAAANTNGDDGLSPQELQAQARADFAAADKNGDGKLN